MKAELSALIEKVDHTGGIEDSVINAYCNDLVTGIFPSGQVLRQVLTDLGYHRKMVTNSSNVRVYMWDLTVIV